MAIAKLFALNANAIIYPISKGIKNTITWKPLFRRNPTFLSKLDLSEAIT